VAFVKDLISPITSAIGGFLDFKTGLIRKNILGVETESVINIRKDISGAGLEGSASNGPAIRGPRLVTPQEKFFREENMSVQRTEVTIKDETGRAEITRGGQGGGFQLEPTGTF
jgi:hypothetical protein